tara:strand:- start:9745 stop:10623 length:879 start_codon:yes stop_codon:yes gene_type:complete
MYILKILNIKLGQRGFSLAEGMVTAALLGVVSLAMLQGLKEDSKTKQLMRQEDEIQAVMSRIDELMKDSDSCFSTLSVNGVTRDSLPSGPSMTRINDGSGAVATYTEKVNGATPVPLNLPLNLQGGNLTISSARVASFKKFFEVSSTGTAAAFDKEYGMMEMSVNFTQTAQKRTVTISRSINITVVASKSSGAIVECANPADLVALQMKQKVCGQAWDPTGNNIMLGSFDANTGECKNVREPVKHIGAKELCLELGGKMVANGSSWRCTYQAANCVNGIQGWNPDGSVICAP